MKLYHVWVNGYGWTVEASSVRVAVNKAMKAEDAMRKQQGRKLMKRANVSAEECPPDDRTS